MEFLSRLLGLDPDLTKSKPQTPEEIIDFCKPIIVIGAVVGCLAFLAAMPSFEEADKYNSGFPKVGGFFAFIGIAAWGIAFVAFVARSMSSEQIKLRPIRREIIGLLETRIRAMEMGLIPSKPEPQIVNVDIIVPPIERWNGPKAISFMKAFLDSSKTGKQSVTTMSMIGTDKGLRFMLYSEDTSNKTGLTRAGLEHLVRAHYRDAQVIDSQEQKGPYPLYSQFAILARKPSNFFSPALSAEQIISQDPLSVVAQTLANLLPDERLRYVLFVLDKVELTEAQIGQYTNVSVKKAEAFARSRYGYPTPRVDLTDRVIDLALGQIFDTPQIPRPDWNKTEHDLYGAKLAQPLYTCFLTLRFVTPHKERMELISAPLAALEGLSLPPHTCVEKGFVSSVAQITSDQEEEAERNRIFSKYADLTADEAGVNRYGFSLTASELAAFWHLPYQGFLSLTGPKQVQAPDTVRELSSGIVLGDNCFGSIEIPVHMLNADRNDHMIVFGSTGTGKSTYLLNLIHQDIAQGRGVAVIDPHGDLINDILKTSIPQERKEDVMVWDIANTQNPPPLNLLVIPPGFDPQTAVTQLLAAFNGIWPDFSWAEMGDTLEMALQTLIYDETPTLLDVDRLFTDETYRDQLLDKADDLVLDRFWEKFDAEKSASQYRLISPVLRRLRAFYGNANLRPVMCHKMGLNLTSLIAENKVVLISLKAPDDMQLPAHSLELMGTILVNQFQLAAMARAATQHFYLYVDEAQHFVTTAIDEIFTEARKRKLSLTLSHQFLGQLKGKTLDAVMENVGAMTVFGCGADSARQVAPHFRPEFEVEDLVKFDKFQAAVRMRVGGRQQPTFTLNTRPAPQPVEGKPTAEEVRQFSVQKYTPMTREEVLKWLEERYPSKRRKRKQDEDSGENDFSEPVE